jgi:hypothetical protein
MSDKNTPVRPAAQKRYVITDSQGKPSKSVEIAGLPFAITPENVNDANVLKTIANFESRTGRKIIGKYVRLQ